MQKKEKDRLINSHKFHISRRNKNQTYLIKICFLLLRIVFPQIVIIIRTANATNILQ